MPRNANSGSRVKSIDPSPLMQVVALREKADALRRVRDRRFKLFSTKIAKLEAKANRLEKKAKVQTIVPKAEISVPKPGPMQNFADKLVEKVMKAKPGEELDIPDYLRRPKKGDTPEERLALLTAHRERKELMVTKRKGAAARRKAQRSGEAAKMPLSGSAALDFIRNG